MKIVNGVIAVVGLLVALAVVWGNWKTDEANEHVDAGNAMLQEGNKHLTSALEKLNAVEQAAFPTDADNVRKLAQQGADLYAQSSKCFRESAAKFQTASETIHDSVLKEYFAKEQKSVAKLAELQELLHKYLLVYTDPTITDAATLEQKISGFGTQVTTLSTELGVLQADATQFAKQHKDKISKPK